MQTQENRPSPYAINADSLIKIASLGAKPSEIELAAALMGNGVDIMTMPRQSRFRICKQAAIISEFIDATDETRFTLYDMVEAILDSPSDFRLEAFPSHETWYEAVLDKAISQREKYTK